MTQSLITTVKLSSLLILIMKLLLFYRALSETAKRIDVHARKCQNVAQIFYDPEILGLQNRLRSLRSKLFQCELSGSELKTVELEWRKCVYEPITLAKRLKSVRHLEFLFYLSKRLLNMS
jgi:hypothetical protein